MKNLVKIAQLMVLAAMATLWGCSSESGTATTSLAGVSVSAISLHASQLSIKSDDVDKAIITATVLNSNNAVVPDVIVNFSSTGGELSSGSGTTDSNGQVTVEVTSGSIEPSNQIISVTATYSTISRVIPITIYGSTISLSPSNPTLVVGGGTETITAEVLDAASQPISNASTTLTITGNAVFTVTGTNTITGLTTSGNYQASIQATAAGAVTVIGTAVGANFSLPLTATVPASALTITTPATNPAYQTVGTNQDVIVTGPVGTTVKFVTTIGTWSISGTAVQDVVIVGAGTATATLQNVTGGTSTVTVLDDADPSKFDMTNIIFTSAAVPDQVIFQTDENILSISTATVQDSTVITAYVTSSGLPVANTGVFFTFSDPDGTGAFLSTAYGTTDETGRVDVRFTSGTQSTDPAGIDVSATTISGGISGTVNIVVGGTAGSVVIGIGSAIYENVAKTHYRLPIGITVADATNTPVAGALVTLSNWPLYAHPGYRYEDAGGDCITVRTYSIANEDVNKSFTLDAGEDLAYAEGVGLDFDNDDPADPGFETETIIADAAITPPNSAAGTLPSAVTTDANGTASFELTYLKQDSGFITTEITASTWTFGTETIGKHSFVLYVIDDATEQCNLGPSRFNP